MGTALRFNEEARACAVAYHLAALGHGVLWDPKDGPNLVTTSAGRAEVRRVCGEFKLVDEGWFKRSRLDVDIAERRRDEWGWNVYSAPEECVGFYRDPAEALRVLRYLLAQGKDAYALDYLTRRCSTGVLEDVCAGRDR